MSQKTVVTVSQLNFYVKSMLTADPLLDGLLVRGEISNFTRHYKSGHLYFTLKDEKAAVKAVMFRGDARYLKFSPENGMSVIVTGSVTLYERDGSYQLYVTDIQPDGVGALYLAFEQLKEKLAREGLFDKSRKRPLPLYPETIGIVTSEGAAALQDMLHILERRWPVASIRLYPAQVQGAGAPKTLIDGLRCLNEVGCDVILLGRGGGSMEDLWAFNDEALAREIVAGKIPVISAVGHETDFTIADFAADVRAPTPSAAAELAVPNLEDTLYYLDGLFGSCHQSAMENLTGKEQRLERAKARLRTPAGVVEGYMRRLDWVSRDLRLQLDRKLDQIMFRLAQASAEVKANGPTVRLEALRERLRHGAELVEASSPVRLLEKGYSLTTVHGKPVRSVHDVVYGDQTEIRVQDGVIFSQVIETKTKQAENGRTERGSHGKTIES